MFYRNTASVRKFINCIIYIESKCPKLRLTLSGVIIDLTSDIIQLFTVYLTFLLFKYFKKETLIICSKKHLFYHEPCLKQ